MIRPPASWTSTRVPNGLLLIPPEGRAIGEIHYRLRKPIGDLPQLLERKRLPEPGFEVESMLGPEPLVTDEGEYASLYVDTGRLDGRRIQRCIGLVFGDDFFARTSSIAFSEPHFPSFEQTVRELVIGDTLVLGENRRRQYRYQPPEGWRGEPFDFEMTWFPPLGSAHSSATITVFPALPLLGAPKESVDVLVASSTEGGDFVVTQLLEATPVSSARGLVGKSWEIRGRFTGGDALARLVTILCDDRFVYPIRLDAPPARIDPGLREVLARLVRSVDPLPVPRRARPLGSTLAQQWLE
jgi:hypothetical protein